MSNAIEALKLLMFLNPQRHDGHAYELEIAMWGLGNADKPVALDFGQPEPNLEHVEDFYIAMKEIEVGE